MAEAYALSTGKMNLRLTEGGKYLESSRIKNFEYIKAIKPWDILSSRFAESASGEVTLFTHGAGIISIFKRIEAPVIHKNQFITNEVLSPDLINTNRFLK